MSPLMARAVIVYGGTGTQNATATGTAAPFDRVGIVNGCTGVYLGSIGGEDWVLTANHVGAGSFSLNGTSYSAVSGSAVRLLNTNGTEADLLLYRIDTTLDWSLLSLASSAITTGTSVTMIGNGYNRATSLTTWYASGTGSSTTWSTTWSAGAAAVSGYTWADGNTLRWGTNTVSDAPALLSFNNTVCAGTTFDPVSDDAQGAVGDSGGGVFTRRTDGTWTLSGIMLAIGGYANQPSAALLGDATYFADLSAYRNQILTTIPEPATVPVLLGLAALGCAVVRRWRRR
jgi:hypothetical protein